MRLIDADKLPVVTEWCVDEAGFGASFHVVHEEDINKTPTIDPESLRPQGEWKIFKDEEILIAECPNCGMVVEATQAAWWDYCPNCGAYMKGGTP